MPVTLVTSPPLYNKINSNIDFIFNMSGIETADEVRSFAYQLVDANTNAKISPIYSYTPSDGVNFKISVQQDLAPFLSTPQPDTADLFTGFVNYATGMEYKFALIYWELTFYKNTPANVLLELACISEKGAEQRTGDHTVLNCAITWWDESPTFAGVSYMSKKPVYRELCRGSNDLMYIFHPTTPISWEISTRDSQGDFLGIFPTTLPVFAQPIGPSILNFGPSLSQLSDQVEYLDITITGGGANIFQYTLRLVDCCCDDVEVYFQSECGGYNSILGTIQKDEVVSSSDELYRMLNITSQTLNGVMTANKESYLEYRIQFKIKEVCGEHYDSFFYTQFMSSGHYFLKIKNAHGEYRMMSVLASNFSSTRRETGLLEGKFKIHAPNFQPNYYL